MPTSPQLDNRVYCQALEFLQMSQMRSSILVLNSLLAKEAVFFFFLRPCGLRFQNAAKKGKLQKHQHFSSLMLASSLIMSH